MATHENPDQSTKAENTQSGRGGDDPTKAVDAGRERGGDHATKAVHASHDGDGDASSSPALASHDGGDASSSPVHASHDGERVVSTTTVDTAHEHGEHPGDSVHAAREHRHDDPPRHRLAGWLEQPGERTRIDAFAEEHDHEGHPRPPQWDQVVEIPSTPLRPPGYDFWVTALRMTLILLALAWMPMINGVVAGLLGGWRAGNLRRALGASLLSVAVLGVTLYLAFVFRDETRYFFYGLSLPTWLLLVLGFTLLGAWAGVSCRWSIREDQGRVRRWTEGPWATPRRHDWVEG